MSVIKAPAVPADKSTMTVDSSSLPSRGRSDQNDAREGRFVGGIGSVCRPAPTAPSGFQGGVRPRIACPAEDSHSGLVRTLGKRVE